MTDSTEGCCGLLVDGSGQYHTTNMLLRFSDSRSTATTGKQCHMHDDNSPFLLFVPMNPPEAFVDLFCKIDLKDRLGA